MDKLGTTEAALRVAVHRLRARFTEVMRAEIAATLDDPSPAAIDEELNTSFAVLGSNFLGSPQQSVLSKINATRRRHD